MLYVTTFRRRASAFLITCLDRQRISRGKKNQFEFHTFQSAGGWVRKTFRCPTLLAWVDGIIFSPEKGLNFIPFYVFIKAWVEIKPHWLCQGRNSPTIVTIKLKFKPTYKCQKHSGIDYLVYVRGLNFSLSLLVILYQLLSPLTEDK